MSDLTPERLAEIEARCEAATPGPWQATCSSVCFNVEVGRAEAVCRQPIGADPDEDNEPACRRWIANRELIAHARADIPALVAEVRRLRERVSDEDALDDYIEHVKERKARIAELEADLRIARDAQKCECRTDDVCRFARERDAALGLLRKYRRSHDDRAPEHHCLCRACCDARALLAGEGQ